MAKALVSILDLLRQNAQGTRYLAEMGGDRHLIEAPIELVEVHNDFSKIRAADPEDLSLLNESMKGTDGAVYPILLYIELIDGALRIFVADGHQRLRAATENGEKRIFGVYVSSWTTVSVAMKEAVAVQFAKYATTEQDVVSMLRNGRLTQAEISRSTGIEQTKVNRLAKLATEALAYLYEATQLKVLGLVQAGKLVDACNSSGVKLAALKNTLSERITAAQTNATFWDNHMKSSRRKWDSKTKEKARVSTYFKGENWSLWIDALTADADAGIIDKGGRKFLKLDGIAGGKSGVRIGDATDWSKEFAVYGLFGKKLNDVDTADIKLVLKRWDDLRAILTAIANNDSIPTFGPEIVIEAPPAPATQEQPMRVRRKTATTAE